MSDIPARLALTIQHMLREAPVDFENEIDIKIRPGQLLGTEIQVKQTLGNIVSSYTQIMRP